MSPNIELDSCLSVSIFGYTIISSTQFIHKIVYCSKLLMRGSGERINQKSESSRIQQFFYAGYSHAEFRKYREQIAEGNRSVLHSFCLVGLSVSLGLLIISAIPSSVLSQSTGFFALSVLFGTVK